MSPIASLLLAAVLVSGRNLENKLSYEPGEKMTFGIACLYNALKGPKRISWYQGSTHSYIPRDKDAQVYELKTSEGAMK